MFKLLIKVMIVKYCFVYSVNYEFSKKTNVNYEFLFSKIL